MKRPTPVLLASILFGTIATAQDPPLLSSWLRNTNGRTGYNNLPADVQQVRHSTNWVYVNSSNIPAYTIGPWPGNPNTPTNQNFLLKFSRTPVENIGTKTSTGLGSIAFWKNGVAAFNALDAMSYNNQGIWHQNAAVVEASSFDACLGHPAPGGTFHHHQNPRCLYSYTDSTHHAPLLGYAYDGFPIYGAYGYVNANGTGGIARILSSYRTRSITQRTTLPDGTVLQASQYGPAVSTQYPLGYYVEDYEYVSGLGYLDAYNGRLSVTPEYPSGIYAYYTTMNADRSSAYPYIIGPKYYGVVATENITSQGHVTVSEAVTVYNPSTGVGEAGDLPTQFSLRQNYPNPFNPTTKIEFQIASHGLIELRVFDVLGREVAMLVNEELQPNHYSVEYDASKLASGVYYYRLRSEKIVAVKQMVLLR